MPFQAREAEDSRSTVQRHLVSGDRERKQEKLLLYNSINIVCKNVLPTETGGMTPDNLTLSHHKLWMPRNSAFTGMLC